jgi:diphosphomevalonate decarboxylase
MHEKPMVFTAEMPTNVSLIGHLFSPSCVAFSLPNLVTKVNLTTHRGTKDTWNIRNTERLSYQSIDQYLKHLQRVKSHFGYEGGFFVQSNNNFPMGVGLASSSSSFSALTACAVDAIMHVMADAKAITREQTAELSAKGKASSQHSFFSPWSIMENQSITGASFSEYDHLNHVALVMNAQQKRLAMPQVLSLIEKNPKVETYIANVRKRVMYAHEYIQTRQWKALFECCWEDFNELHTLFHTSKPSFSFQDDASRALLQQVKHWWDIYDDGPLVVMGVGYVVHLLFRQDQEKMQEKMLKTLSYDRAVWGTGAAKEIDLA